MITKVSVIGTLENGETRTASVSVKGRTLNSDDSQNLIDRDSLHIEPELERFTRLEVWLEMKKNQWKKGLKVKMEVTPINSFDERAEAVVSMFMVANYEFAVGRFRDCKL